MAITPNNVIEIPQRQKRWTHTFDERTVTGRTQWLDIGEYPTSSIQLFKAETGATFSADVEISNVPVEIGYEVAAAAVSANTVTALTKGARYVRINWKAVSGRVGAIWHGALQS